ncbi:AMP-binding protein, partial [bacterium]|nr:AMP-binding protein [bacterium]
MIMAENGSTASMQPDSYQETIVQMVDARADQYGDRPVMRYKQDDAWLDVTWQQLADSYKDVARGLLQLGLGRGDSIAILSENRPEWATTDFGAMAAGLVGVPLYTTLIHEQIAYILHDAEAKV